MRNFLLIVCTVDGLALHASSFFPALLGNGYDTLMLETRQTSCVEGEVIEQVHVENSTSLSKVESWTELQAKLNFEVPGSVFMAGKSELAKFTLRARDTRHTSTYILNNHVAAKRTYLNNPRLIEDTGDLRVFRETCGTEYISVVTEGGKLYVGIKFSFSTTKFKEEFDAGGAIQTVAGLGAHVDSLTENTRQNSSVEIFFHQVGGSLSELSSMFESGDIVACSLDNFSKCESLLTDVWEYSTNKFVKSVLNGKSQPISFESIDYPGVPRVYENHKVRTARQTIINALDHYYYDLDILNSIKGKTGNYSDFDHRTLNFLISKVLSNIRILKESIMLSFENPERFLSQATLDSLSLYPVEMPAKKHDYLRIPRELLSYLTPQFLYTSLASIASIALIFSIYSRLLAARKA